MVKRGTHLEATRADGLGGDGTARALVGLNQGRHQGTMGCNEVKDSYVVREDNWRIARETSESDYRCNSERVGKTEIVYNGNSMDRFNVE